MRKALILATILAGLTVPARALDAVAPLPGYACMTLALPADQLQGFKSLPSVFAEPSPKSAKVGTVGGVVIVKTPLRVVHGYAEVLHLSGQPAWISAKLLRPYGSASDPNAHCTPSMMSNGRPGFGP